MNTFEWDQHLSRDNWLGRSLRWPLDRMPKTWAVPIVYGPLVTRRWIVGAGIHRCWMGTYEIHKQRKMRSHLERGMVACDIGANAGFYSLLMSRFVGPEGRVYAFEPHPVNAGFLRRHLALNRTRNVIVCEQAVADFDGECGFHAGSDGYQGRLNDAARVRVQVASLDQLHATGFLPPSDLLKIDVEGAELQVLHGARRFISRFRPVIFLATHGREVHRACCEMLREVGYKLQGLDGRVEVGGTDEIIALNR